jgi:glutamyl-Q tRNA(Asp) synthetase
MTTKFITRFAPTPTGLLHLGHAWSALIAHDRARAAGGGFVLRIEDIDQARCRPHFADAIMADLAWLGLEWDSVLYQSSRMSAYAAAAQRLRQAGLLYPCFCTRAEIAREAAASLHAPQSDGSLRYPGTCRALSSKARARRLSDEPHSWRLDAAAAFAVTGPLWWQDEEHGSIACDPAAMGDLIIEGRGAIPSYHLAVVIDDAAQKVTHVIRGTDLFQSTHAQRILQAALDLPTPNYVHHALVCGPDGQRLAKRRGSKSLAEFRDTGCDPDALKAMLREGRFPVGFSARST